MKYLLLVLILCIYGAVRSFRWAQKQGDDFGAVLAPLFFVVLSIWLAVAYLWMALHYHRFY